MRIFRQRGLDELYLKTAERMANTNLDIQGMVRDGSKEWDSKPILGIPVRKWHDSKGFVRSGGMEKSELLEKGKFYLAQRKGQGWGVFYVNPVDWLDEESDNIGLVYLGWDGIRTLIDNPNYFVNQIDSKGWNKTLADVGSIKEYKDDPRLQKLLQEREQKGFDLSSAFFQDEGWVFYEIPNVPTRLGVMNWWW